MNATPCKLTLAEWDNRYAELLQAGLREPWYGGSLRSHVSRGGNLRLQHLQFDNSAARFGSGISC